MGGEFSRAFLATIEELRTGAVSVVTELPAAEVPRWEMHEFSIKGRAHVTNPFRDAALVGEFVSPAGKTNVLDGFYDGDEVWRLRFAPDEEGEWSYVLRGEGVLGLTYGFLANGSRSVVAALWPIEDAATARFMNEFYRAYRSSGKASEALREAHLRTRDTADAAVWSSFVVRANGFP